MGRRLTPTDVTLHPEFTSISTLRAALGNTVLALVAANPVLLADGADDQEAVVLDKADERILSLTHDIYGLTDKLASYRRNTLRKAKRAPIPF